MHETVVAKNIIKEAKRYGSVKEIYLEIGELSPVPTDELIECLHKLVDWKIHYKEVPSTVRCSCGFIGHPKIIERGHDYFLIECPKCKSIPTIVGGNNIKILKVSVE